MSYESTPFGNRVNCDKTVSTTAFPIHSLEYPAITICGQGMATDTLDKVLKERFESWMRARNLDLNRKTLMI